MTTKFEQVQSIFMAAIERPADQWNAYLTEVCGTDAGLREQVDMLLKAHQAGRGLLDHPIASDMATALPSSPSRSIIEGPGTMVGRYKLLQEIGEGGMGVVYMAEQEQPVRRRVALKIIKPGMDSAQVIARFEAERQALAMMDHPNIARVFDAGTTDTGRPYFVMELVQGIPITKYCDDKQLDTHARLELFVQVCNAIQHAHQKGIIHRDLKPSNVLIAIYDGTPVPKIIDFGVAKALHQRLTEKTMFTQFGAVVGTLEYMSPEQADMDLIGTDTRSDIYSLGVLLYELLTGSTPMDGKTLRSLGYAEMLKTIRELDPPTPSTRLTQSRADLGTISAKRHTEPRRLQKLVAGDLDWIVMKCLEKDRARRYETANGLAMDIQRHLQNEAVTASPPGQIYKFRKLVRRNKLACTAAACVMLALVLGLAASLWQANRASREAARAQQEADRAGRALYDLRAAAPSIAAEAHALAAQEKFDEAIAKLDYASKLCPEIPGYLLAKADLLESQMRLADAAAIYRAVLKLNPNESRAQENAELCEKLAAAPEGADGKLTRESLSLLSTQMTSDERPAAEIMPIARLLGNEKNLIVSYWLDRLKDLPNATDKPMDKRLTVRWDGLLDLDLSDIQIPDLLPLAGMPLGGLNIQNCQDVDDLSPLHGMPLTQLNVAGTGVTSLEPLRGMNSLAELTIGLRRSELTTTSISDLSPLSGLQLTFLEAAGCPVTSLAPLRGMPLETLRIEETAIVDLSPLAGMPLTELDLTNDPVTDFKPLIGLPLQILMIQGMRVGDLGFLKGMPLEQLSMSHSVGARNLAVLSEIPALQVLCLPSWSDLSVEDLAAIEKLRNHPSLKQIADWTPITISLTNTPSKDEFWKNWDRDYAWIFPLRKAGITFSSGFNKYGGVFLTCHDQPLTDLSLFAGGHFQSIDLARCHVSDLTPLQNQPLKSLNLNSNPVTDLSPLRGMRLEWLSLFRTRVHDLSPLSGMPIKFLQLRFCDNLTDLTPLANCSALDEIVLPSQIADLEPLRKLPALKHIGFTAAGMCTADVFWKTWDGLPWARKLEAAAIDFSFKQSQDGYYEVTIHDRKFSDCSIFTGSKNVRRLDLDNSHVADLSPLANLPLVTLSLRETPVTDLSPLRSAVLCGSLQELQVRKTSITDFSPVAGCAKLEIFDAADTALSDLSIVKGMNLRILLIERTAVPDLSPLAGMPLTDVALGGTPATDISPLLKCPTLNFIVLPSGASNVGSLRALPNVRLISLISAPGGLPDKTADEFWAEYDRKQSAAATQPAADEARRP